MRILMVTQWFDPEPFFKGLSFARELQKRDHQVEVVTGFPNYPGGKLYDGYTLKVFQRECIDGIRVNRVPLYPSHDGSAVRRIGNYISFALSAAAIGPLMTRGADVIYVYHPPATVGLPAVVLKGLKGAPVVYDIQDMWPDTLAATGMVGSPTLMKCVDIWCRGVYRAASRIAVLSPGFKKRLIDRGVPAEKIDVIYNWAEESVSVPEPDSNLAAELGFAGKFNIIFAGTMGKAQALEAVLDAAAFLMDRCPNIQFVFIGGGIEAPRLEARARERGLSNVLFLPRRPMSEIGKVLALADVLLVHLKDDPLFEITVPSKIQSYLRSGKPILAAVSGDGAALVAEAGAGISARPENGASIADAAQALAEMPERELKAMGEAAHQYYLDKLSMQAGVDKFERLFYNAAAHRGEAAE